MMKPAPPRVIGHGAENMQFVCYAVIPQDKRRTVKGPSLAGPGPREECGWAIFEGDGGYYLFTCDALWHVMWDSHCQDLHLCKFKDVQWMDAR
jgi:hypothetical protein